MDLGQPEEDEVIYPFDGRLNLVKLRATVASAMVP